MHCSLLTFRISCVKRSLFSEFKWMSNFSFQVLVPPSEHHTIHTQHKNTKTIFTHKKKTDTKMKTCIQTRVAKLVKKYMAEWSMLVGYAGLKKLQNWTSKKIGSSSSELGVPNQWYWAQFVESSVDELGRTHCRLLACLLACCASAPGWANSFFFRNFLESSNWCC